TVGGPARDHVVDSVLWVCNADAAAGVGLRVEVDEQHAAPLDDGCSQVDGRRRLPYAALLVDHPDDGQALPPRSRNATRLPSRPRRRSAATAIAAAVSAPTVSASTSAPLGAVLGRPSVLASTSLSGSSSASQSRPRRLIR